MTEQEAREQLKTVLSEDSVCTSDWEKSFDGGEFEVIRYDDEMAIDCVIGWLKSKGVIK